MLIQHEPAEKEPATQPTVLRDVDEDFKPFASQGFLSSPGNGVDRVPTTILRDTCAKYSIVHHGILPFSDWSYCGSDLLV